MHTVSEGVRSTYVVFTKSQHWLFNTFLKEGYEHCYALIWDGYQFVCLDKAIDKTHVHTIEEYKEQILYSPNDIFKYLSEDDLVTSVIEVDVDKIVDEYRHTRSNFLISLIRPNSCVEYVKDYLGMNTLKYLSPYRLYKHIT